MIRGRWRSGVVVAGAWLALAGGVAGIAAAQPQSPQAAARAEFLTALRQSAAAGTLRLMERYYPQEARALMDRLFKQAASISNDFADMNSAKTAAMSRAAIREMEAFLASKRKDIANAPAAQLMLVMNRQLAVLGRLEAENPAACGAIVTARPFGLDPTSLTRRHGA